MILVALVAPGACLAEVCARLIARTFTTLIQHCSRLELPLNLCGHVLIHGPNDPRKSPPFSAVPRPRPATGPAADRGSCVRDRRPVADGRPSPPAVQSPVPAQSLRQAPEVELSVVIPFYNPGDAFAVTFWARLRVAPDGISHEVAVSAARPTDQKSQHRRHRWGPGDHPAAQHGQGAALQRVFTGQGSVPWHGGGC